MVVSQGAPAYGVGMYEHKSQPLISHGAFLVRVAGSVGAALALVAVSLAIGMLGYHGLEGLGWLDAFVNAAMLLGGMGPVAPLTTDAGKLFAGCYALYCGLVVILVAGIVLAPLAHRMLHRIHLDV